MLFQACCSLRQETGQRRRGSARIGLWVEPGEKVGALGGGPGPRQLGASGPQASAASDPIWVRIKWELRSQTFPWWLRGSVFSSSWNRN